MKKSNVINVDDLEEVYALLYHTFPADEKWNFLNQLASKIADGCEKLDVNNLLFMYIIDAAYRYGMIVAKQEERKRKKK